MMIYSERCAICLCEQIYFYAVLVNVLMQLNSFCLGHIVSACTMLACGLTTILGARPNSSCVIINVSKCFLALRDVTV